MGRRVVLFGATGRTGRLVLAALVARGRRPLLAGRDGDRLRRLAAEHGGLEVARADARRPKTVEELIGPDDVLVATAGPYARVGAAAVAAAALAGAVYLDCTGEPAFIREVFVVHGQRARRSGALLIPAMGFDYAPGSAAAALAVERAGRDCTRVDVAYFVERRSRGGGVSAGTARSAAGIALADCFALRGGRLLRVPVGDRTRSFGAGGRSRRALSIGGAEPFALPSSYPQLRDVDVYAGFFGGATATVAATVRSLAALRRLPGGTGVLSRATERVAALTATGGEGDPDPGTGRVVATAHDATGRRLAHVELAGARPYALTAETLAWAADAALSRRPGASGAAGPISAFGLPALVDALSNAGMAEDDGHQSGSSRRATGS